MRYMNVLFRLVIGLLLLSTSTASAASLSSLDMLQSSGPVWPMLLGGPERNGNPGAEGPSGSNVVATPLIQTNAAINSSPAYANGMIFFGNDEGYIWAVDAASGQAVQKIATGGPVTSSPAVDTENGIVYVGTVKGLEVLSIDGLTEIGIIGVGGGVSSSPAVAGDLVYFVGGDGNLYVHEASSGFQLSTPIGPSSYSSPAVTDDYVLVGASDGLHILKRSGAGTTLQIDPLTVVSTDAPVDGTPVVSGDRIYFVTTAGTVASIDLADLTGLVSNDQPRWCWSYQFFTPVSLTPTVVNDSVLVTDGENLQAISTANNQCGLAPDVTTIGTVNLSMDQNLAPGTVASAIAVAGNGLFFGSGNQVYGVAGDGRQINWSVPLGGEVGSVPAVANGLLYVGASDGFLYEISSS
jgi:outer membrane protein assembly factor BamB